MSGGERRQGGGTARLASKRGIDLGGPQWRTYSAKDEKSIDEELTAAASVLMLGWISRAIGTNSENVTSASAVCDGLILITTCTARPTSTVRSTTMRKRRHAIARCTGPDVEAAGARPAFSGARDMGPFTSWTLSAISLIFLSTAIGVKRKRAPGLSWQSFTGRRGNATSFIFFHFLEVLEVISFGRVG